MNHHKGKRIFFRLGRLKGLARVTTSSDPTGATRLGVAKSQALTFFLLAQFRSNFSVVERDLPFALHRCTFSKTATDYR